MKKRYLIAFGTLFFLGQTMAIGNCYQFDKREVSKVILDCQGTALDKSQINQCIEKELSMLSHQGNSLAQIALLGFYKDQHNLTKVQELKQKIDQMNTAPLARCLDSL